jgi:hypothetical protein
MYAEREREERKENEKGEKKGREGKEKERKGREGKRRERKKNTKQESFKILGSYTGVLRIKRTLLCELGRRKQMNQISIMYHTTQRSRYLPPQ